MPSIKSPERLLLALPTEASDLYLDDITVGLSANISWRAERQLVDRFAELSGDKNPLHMDDEYAKSQEFDGRVVHGFLLGAHVSGIVGMLIPGRRCLLLEEKLAFPNPVYIDDELLFTISVEEVHPDLSLVMLKIIAKRAEQTVMRGRVTCKLLS